MGNRGLWLLMAVLGFEIVAFAQTSERISQPSSPPTAGTCQSTFTSGSGVTFFQFCVTVNGNITEFHSPAGWEHIAGAVPGQEGYGVCDNDTKVRYFDYTSDSGNWSNAVITQPGGPNTLPLKITRTSSDGVFTLTQAFSRNPSERIAKISMTLKNNTGSSKIFTLVRFANVNANNSSIMTVFDNRFDSGGDSSWAYNLGLFGVRLSTVPTPLEHAAFVDGTNDGPDPCAPGSSSPPTHPFYGDGGLIMAYVLALSAEQATTVGVEYKRF